MGFKTNDLCQNQFVTMYLKKKGSNCTQSHYEQMWLIVPLQDFFADFLVSIQLKDLDFV
jgi:hypothetical protein